MAKIRGGAGGWRRRPRRLSVHSLSTGRVDYKFDVVYSEGNSSSSNYGESDVEGRDKVIDDALFGFLSKEAVKTLKRNFSDFCKDMPGTNKAIKKTTDGVDRSFFSRFGIKYYLEVVKNLTVIQRSVIEKFGSGSLLLFDCWNLPSDFVRWVAECIDPVCSQITLRGEPIDISKESFHIVLGLPVAGIEIRGNSEDGKDFILSHFNLSVMPHITFFGNKLSSYDPLSELDVFVCFMSVAMSCFLCPDVNDSVNRDYISVLKDPAAAKGYDFSKLVYDHCISSLFDFSSFGKSRGRRMKAPICCNFVLAVRYLDCLDFGIQNVDETVLRVLVWRGNMIKAFSDLDRKSRHYFGKKQLKRVYAGLRLQNQQQVQGKPNLSPGMSLISSGFRLSVKAQFSRFLKDDVIDGVVNIVDRFVSAKPPSNKRKVDSLVSNVLNFLSKYSDVNNKCLRVPAEINGAQFAKQESNVNLKCEGSEAVLEKSPHTAHKEPHAFPSGSFNNAELGTPDCVITKVLERSSSMSAPKMNPTNKVKARRFNLISKEDEQTLIGNHSSPKFDVLDDFSKVPHVSKLESSLNKPQTGNFKLNRLENLQKQR